MSSLILRGYQKEGVADIGKAFRRVRKVVYVLPTGGGKTTIFCHIAHRVDLKGNRVLILVHRDTLLDQASQSLTKAGVDHGMIAPGYSLNMMANVQVASVQTLARRLGQFETDHFQLIIVDEAHHTNAGTWEKVLGHFSAARLLGVTATPCRTDGRGLGEWYQELLLGPSPQWLTDNGYLAPARVFCPGVGADVSQLRTRMGDFDMSGASQQMGELAIMGNAVEHFRRYIGDGTAIAFCCSVQHAEDQAAEYRAAGIPAASIDGTMTTDQKRQLLADLGVGRIQVLTSCQLIGEGVDVPSVTGCQLLRPTKSVSLHLQMVGRCLRPQEGKTAVILDHVGNYTRPGLCHHLNPPEWTLDGVVKKKKEAAMSVKECPECQAAMVSTARSCPECGHEFVVEPRVIEVVKGELREVSAEEVARRQLRAEQRKCGSLEELVAHGIRAGMKNPQGWARHVMAARSMKAGRAKTWA
jgi:DNA repair protein RadD